MIVYEYEKAFWIRMLGRGIFISGGCCIFRILRSDSRNDFEFGMIVCTSSVQLDKSHAWTLRYVVPLLLKVRKQNKSTDMLFLYLLE